MGWRDLHRSFGGYFSHFWPQNKLILRSLAVFLKKLFERPSLFLFIIGKCQYCGLVNFRSSKIWWQKLNQLNSPQKCSWLTFEPQFLAADIVCRRFIILVPTVNFQPNSKNSFIWIIHEQTVYRNLKVAVYSLLMNYSYEIFHWCLGKCLLLAQIQMESAPK